MTLPARLGAHRRSVLLLGPRKRLSSRLLSLYHSGPIAPLRRFSVASISIKLPPDSTVEDPIERLYFLAKVERGAAQADAGETLSHVAARKRLLK
jgi:hypothetical protein